MRRAGSIAVAVHDVEPATFERCALIRDWLDDHGVERVTLLVIPAPDLHPFNERRPDMVEWLAECQSRGDAIAQHGFQHRASAAAPRRSNPAAEFLGLDADETRRAVEAGRRVLRLAGVRPRGFVAPAYAYTDALHETLAASFEWWASLVRVHHAARSTSARTTLSPALTLGTSNAVKRLASPWLVRAGALAAGDLLRLDLHPADLDHPRHIGAVEGVLKRAHRRVRQAVTYDDLLAA
jgi:predicted deacetylase